MQQRPRAADQADHSSARSRNAGVLNRTKRATLISCLTLPERLSLLPLPDVLSRPQTAFTCVSFHPDGGYPAACGVDAGEEAIEIPVGI
jgi:hypothetical protein